MSKADKKLKSALKNVQPITAYLGKRKEPPSDEAASPQRQSVEQSNSVDTPATAAAFQSSLVKTSLAYDAISIRCQKLNTDVEALCANDSAIGSHKTWIIKDRVIMCRPPSDFADPEGFLTTYSVGMVIACDLSVREELTKACKGTCLLHLKISHKHNIKRTKLAQLCALIKTLSAWQDTNHHFTSIALCDNTGSACASLIAIAMVVFVYKCSVLDAAVAVTRLWARSLQRSNNALSVRLMPTSEAMRKAADEIAPMLLQTNVSSSSASGSVGNTNADNIMSKMPEEFVVPTPTKRTAASAASSSSSQQSAAVDNDAEKASARRYYSTQDKTGDGDADSDELSARVKRRRRWDSDDDY